MIRHSNGEANHRATNNSQTLVIDLVKFAGDILVSDMSF